VVPRIFRPGLDYAFIPVARDAERLSAVRRILGIAHPLPEQRLHESLQGSPEVCPLATPRRYHDIQVPLTLPSPRRGEGR